MSGSSSATSPPAAQQTTTTQQPKRNSRDERNFRSHYYEKVGFKGVDERKTIELLLAEDPIDVEKCACFAVKCSVPSERRLVLWKVILGTHALYQKNRESVDKWRRKPYHDIVRACKVMRKVDDSRPKAQNLAVVWLLLTKRLQLDWERQMGERRVQNYVAVAEAALEMCEDEVEAFYVSKGLVGLLEDRWMGEEFGKEMVALYHKLLSNANAKLYSHLDKIGFNSDIPLLKWFGRAFAGVLHQSALERIWDKVIGGSMTVLVYLAVELVTASKVSLLGCQTSKEALRCLTATDELTDEAVAAKALEHWRDDGSVLMPGDFGGKRRQSAGMMTNNSNNGNSSNASLASSLPEVGSLKAAEIKIDLD